jgi:hypothetical protein
MPPSGSVSGIRSPQRKIMTDLLFRAKEMTEPGQLYDKPTLQAPNAKAPLMLGLSQVCCTE